VAWFEIDYPKSKSSKEGKLPKRGKKCDHEYLPESNDNDDNEDVGQHEAQIDLENEENAVKYEMADGGILRKRRRQKVLRYVRYNKESDPANYYRELIMLFHPWRKECDDVPTDLHETLDKYQKNKISIDKKRDEYEKNRSRYFITELCRRQHLY